MTEFAHQSWPMPDRPAPIVLIGAGGIVRSAHLPAYRNAGFPVAGVYDLRPDAAFRLAADFGIPRVYATLAEAVREPGAVFDVAVPAEAALGIVTALPPRAAVLLQKPLGRDLAEARRIVQAAEARGLLAAVNLQLRFAPNLLALRRLLDDGTLGAVRDVEVRVVTHTPWQRWAFLRGIPRLEIVYHSIHYLDLLRGWFGLPEAVHAVLTRHREGYADTASTTLLRYGPRAPGAPAAAVALDPRGARVLVHTCHDHAYGPRHASSALRVEGSEGCAVATLGVNLDYPQGVPDRLEYCLRGGSWQDVPLRGSWFPDAFEGPMANLQRCREGSDPAPVCGVRDALATMALVEAAYRASEAPGVPVPDPSSPIPP